MNRLPRSIPVVFRAESHEGWGSFSVLSPMGARMHTLDPIASKQALRLDFELEGERFESMPAYSRAVDRDEDGYRRVEIDFRRMEDKRRIRDALARILLTVES